MKKLIVVIVLIVIVAAVLPFLNGIFLERTLRKAVDDTNAMQADNPFGYSFEIVNLKRGYSTTDLELKLDMGLLKDIYGIDSVIIKENAKHGYLGVSSTTTLEGNDWYDSFLKDKLNGQDPLHIETVYSLLGGIESVIIIDAFSSDIEEARLNLKKAEIKAISDRSLQNFKISGNWQGLDIDQKFSLNDVFINMDMEKITSSLWAGDMSITIEKIDAADKGQKATISDLKVNTVTGVNQDANTMNFDINYNISSILAETKKIEDASLHLGLKGLKIDALEEFRKTYADFFSNIMPKLALDNAAKSNDEQLKKEMAQMNLKMLAAYERLLKEGLEIQVSDVHVKLPQGEVNGAVTLRLLKDMTFAQFLPFIDQPEELFGALYLKTDISLPVDLVGDKPNLFLPPVPEMKTGVFMKDGDYLVNRMETIDGKLMLNDYEVPLDEIASQLKSRPQARNSHLN